MPSISFTDITLAQLRVFVAVVDGGSFTTAARRLGLTQSAVSHAIASLESMLGNSIVSRERSGVAATSLGERVLADAREMLSRMDDIRRHAAAEAGLDRGTLRVASVPSAAARILPPMLRRFRRRHPSLDVVVLEGPDDEVADWIRQRVADIALLGDEPERLSEFSRTTIADDELLVVVPRGHALAGRGRVRLAALKHEPVLLSGGGCEPLIRRAFERAGIEPRITMVVREMATLLALVRERLGITLVPELALPSGKTAGIAVVGLEPRVSRRVALVTASATSGRVPVVDAFLAAAGVPTR